MKHRPLVLAFSLAFCIVLALLAIGAGELEIYNPRTVQRGNTALSVWSIPVAVAGNVVSNSVVTQSGSDITITGSLTGTGPWTNSTSGGPGFVQNSSTVTNWSLGHLGIGTNTPIRKLSVYGVGWTTANGIGSGDFVITSPGSYGPTIGLQSTATGGHLWNFFSTGPSGLVGAGAFTLRDDTDEQYRMVADKDGNLAFGEAILNADLTGAKFVIKKTGLIGIGTVSPLAGLDIVALGLHVGAAPYDPGVNNAAIEGVLAVGGLSYFTNSVYIGTNSTTTRVRIVPQHQGGSALQIGPDIIGDSTKTNLVPDLITSPLKYDTSGTPSVNKWLFYENPGVWVGGAGMSVNSLDLMVGPSGGFTWFTGNTDRSGTGSTAIMKLESTGALGVAGTVNSTNGFVVGTAVGRDLNVTIIDTAGITNLFVYTKGILTDFKTNGTSVF